MNQKMLYFQPTNYEHSETIKKTRQNGGDFLASAFAGA